MLSFKKFSNFILSEATLVSTGSEAKRHDEKYIKPFVGQTGTHTLKKEHEGIEAESPVTVHGSTVIDGKHHAIVSKVGSRKKVNVPFSKINKPVKQANKGFDFESETVRKLNEHGLMSGQGAGATGGNDFHLINKKTGKKIKGKMAETAYQGETKKDLSAAFGQISLTHHPERGWHISDKTRERFPQLAAQVERATVTVGGKKKSLLQHVNDTYGPPNREQKSSKNVYSDETDHAPLHAYLKDHKVDVLHVGSHGTFRAGLSHTRDRTGIGLPQTKGTGRFRVRQKHRNSLTVQFNVRKMDRSPFDMTTDEGIAHIKNKLGHTE